MASVKPRAMARPRPSPPVVVRSSQALERLEHPVPVGRGHAGAVVDHLRARPRSPCRRGRAAGSAGSGGLAAWALATRLATTRSSRPGSAQDEGQVVGDVDVDRRVAGAGRAAAPGRRPRRAPPAAGATLTARRPAGGSSTAGCRPGRRAGRWTPRWWPAARPASSASRSTSGWRRLDTAALMPASGVRRSWPTAASSAERSRSTSASSRAWAAWSARRWASRVRAAAAASRPRVRRSSAKSSGPQADQAQPVAGGRGQHRPARRRLARPRRRCARRRAAFEQGDRGHAEGVADLVEEPGQRLLGDRFGGARGEQRGLDVAAGGGGLLPGGDVDGDADRGGDQRRRRPAR